MHASCSRLVRLLMIDRGLRGPLPLDVLDVGSYDVNGTLRPVVMELLPNARYTGIDKVAGPNVDFVMDVETLPSALYAPVNDLVLCANVLEHTENPFDAVDNMRLLLRPGGWLIVTVPWNIHCHNNPDRWRISPEGMEVLFRGMLGFRSEFYDGDVRDTWAFAQRGPL